MRAVRWLGVLALGLGLAGPASAQRCLPWGWVGPTQNQITPLSSAQLAMPIAAPMTLQNRTGFRLTDYMPSRLFLGSRPVIGGSVFPAAKDMPNVDYLKPFKYGRGVSVVP
jgi:hypothetical protein